MIDDSNIRILKHITENLQLSSFVKDRRQDGVVEFDVENGNAVGWNLFNIEKIAVARTLLTKDTMFPKHSHESKEWMIVYDGALVVMTSSENNTILSGDSIVIDPGVEHSCKAIKDTWVLCVTIPCDRGFPVN